MNSTIKKGQTVMILTGKYKGKKVKVIAVTKNKKLLLEGLTVFSRRRGEKDNIVNYLPVDRSNVKLSKEGEE